MPGNNNLYTEARKALIERGLTVEKLTRKLRIHRNTFGLALRSPLCPRARKRICAELKIKDAA